jgi:hypothetical protein
MSDMINESINTIVAKQELELDRQIADMKNKKNIANAQMDIKTKQLEAQRSQVNHAQKQLKAQQKQEKMHKDLLKMAIDSDQRIEGNIVDQFAPEVDPDAEGLPMVDFNARNLT